ncbi:hypothetical protein R6Q59_036553 [Mikania micrantha]
MVQVNKRTGLLNYLRMKLYPRFNPLPMPVQAHDQHKGVNTKKNKLGIPNPLCPGSSDDRVQINLNKIDEEEEDDEIEDLTHPIERDRAKADRARARRDSSSQTTPDYNQGMKNLSQRIGDFNELKRERQRLVELQLLFTNTDHLTGVDREIAEREKEKIRNKYRDN